MLHDTSDRFVRALLADNLSASGLLSRNLLFSRGQLHSVLVHFVQALQKTLDSGPPIHKERNFMVVPGNFAFGGARSLGSVARHD
jgi:hypothetical protein